MKKGERKGRRWVEDEVEKKRREGVGEWSVWNEGGEGKGEGWERRLCVKEDRNEDEKRR